MSAPPSPTPDDRVAVVLVNWNRRQLTLDALDRLGAWGPGFEIWIVDNASTDGSATAIAEAIRDRYPTVRLLELSENLGFGAGNNHALRKIDAPWALLLNNDAWIDAEAVDRLVEALRSDPSLAVVGPVIQSEPPDRRVLSAGGRDISRFVRTNLSVDDLPPGRLDAPSPYDVTYVPGTVALVRTEIFREIGLFAEDYFFGAEMADLCDRIRERGRRCAILPTVRAQHAVGVAAPARAGIYPYYILRNRFLYLRHRRPGGHRLKTVGWTLYGLLSILRSIAQGNGARARCEALALADALRGRWGGRNERLMR